MVPRRQRAKVDDLHARATCIRRLVGRRQRALHRGAVRHHRHVRPLAQHLGLAERDHVVGAGVHPLVVRLAVQVLVLEEDHRVVAPDGRAQQAVGVKRRARADDAQAGAVREQRRAGLRVVDGAADVAAVRRAHHHRGREQVVGAPAHGRQLVAQLHVRGPDVVEELDLDHRLEAAMRQPNCAPHDVRLGERRVVHARTAKLRLQAVRRLEHAALPLHLAEVLLARHVGHVLAEDEDARVAPHLVAHRDVDEVHHRRRLTRELRRVFRVERRTRRIDIGRIQRPHRRLRRGLRLLERVVGRGQHLGVHRLVHGLDVRLRGVPLLHEPRGKRHDGIAGRFGFTLVRRLVDDLVVRQRVRVGTNHVRVHERRPLPVPRVSDCLLHDFERRQKIAAIHFLNEQPRERRDELRNRPARGVHFHRHRNGVAVVLDDVHHRQLQVGRRVQRFPKLALRRRAIARGHEHHFVAGEALGDSHQLGAQRALSGTHALQELRSRRRSSRDDIQRLVPPVRRHLASTRVRVRRRAHRAVKHLGRRHAQLQAERAVAVIRVEPVVARLEHMPRRGQHGLMPGARDLEEDLVLPLELDLLVVHAARQEHRPERGEQLVARQSVGRAAVRFR